jgi:N-sulfoglucosamine sulfohydrolase
MVKGGSLDRRHLISGIDFFPTVLEAAGLPVPQGLDGFSFVPLLQGRAQSGRDQVFTQIDMKAGGDAVPMRCVQNHRLGYIFTPWSDGKFVYRNNNEGLTMQAMVEAAQTDPRVAERVRMFRYRVSEELYDLQNDPDCLNNLVDKPDRKNDLDHMRNELQAWMTRTRDPLLPAFENRTDPERVKAVLTSVYGENYTRVIQSPRSAAEKGKKRKKKQ